MSTFGKFLAKRRTLTAIAAGCAGLVASVTAVFAAFDSVCSHHEFAFCPMPALPGYAIFINCQADSDEFAKMQSALIDLGVTPLRTIQTRFGGLELIPGNAINRVVVSSEAPASYNLSGEWLAARLYSRGASWKSMTGSSIYETHSEQAKALVFAMAGPTCERIDAPNARWKERFFPDQPLGDEAVSAFWKGRTYTKLTVLNYIAHSPNAIEFEPGHLKTGSLDKGWVALVGKGLDPQRAEEALTLWLDVDPKNTGKVVHLDQ